MARSQITFTLAQGNSPGALANNDGIGAFQFYGTAPGSFATTACQPVYSIVDAENKGITLDYADETAAKCIITISGSPTAGDTLNITVTEKNPVTPDNPTGLTTVNLGTGTAPATPTVTTYAAAVVAAINALTYSHGYTASNSSGVITITARQGLGINLNPAVQATPVAITGTGTSTYAITQQFGTGSGGATAGVYSKKAIWHYHLARFFATNPNGKVWVQFTSSPGAAFAEIQSLMTAASGEPRFMGVYNFASKSAGQVASDAGLLQTQFNTTFSGYNPCEMLYAPNIAGIADVATLSNLQTAVSAKNVSIVISQDGAAQGAQLFINSGVSITNIGDVVGITSIASVAQDIGEVDPFNISDGSENNIPAFSNGQLVSAVADSLLDQLDSYRYLFCVKYTGFAGTYINNDWTAIIQTNTYNRISRNRTIDKVLRQQYVSLLPLLKSRIFLNSDGTMTTATLNRYLSAAEPSIEQMVRDGDLSPGNITGTALTDGVVQISPTQNVQTQGYVAITYNLLAVNIADNINVTLQFTQKL